MFKLAPFKSQRTNLMQEIKKTKIRMCAIQCYFHALNQTIFCSLYSNLPVKKNQPKSHSNSPKRQDSVTEKNKKDITEYLIKGEIQYPDLLSDEISKVDEALIKDSKKAGQVGGKYVCI